MSAKGKGKAEAAGTVRLVHPTRGTRVRVSADQAERYTQMGFVSMDAKPKRAKKKTDSTDNEK